MYLAFQIKYVADKWLWYFLFQILVPIFQSHQVLSNHHSWLGRGWAAGLSPRLQHAEPTDSQKEPQLSSSGLQLQSETSKNSHNKGEKEVKIWKCFPSLSGDPSTHKAGHRFPCSVQTRQCRQLSGEKENILSLAKTVLISISFVRCFTKRPFC